MHRDELEGGVRAAMENLNSNVAGRRKPPRKNLPLSSGCVCAHKNSKPPSSPLPQGACIVHAPAEPAPRYLLWVVTEKVFCGSLDFKAQEEPKMDIPIVRSGEAVVYRDVPSQPGAQYHGIFLVYVRDRFLFSTVDDTRR